MGIQDIVCIGLIIHPRHPPPPPPPPPPPLCHCGDRTFFTWHLHNKTSRHLTTHPCLSDYMCVRTFKHFTAHTIKRKIIACYKNLQWIWSLEYNCSYIMEKVFGILMYSQCFWDMFYINVNGNYLGLIFFILSLNYK